MTDYLGWWLGQWEYYQSSGNVRRRAAKDTSSIRLKQVTLYHVKYLSSWSSLSTCHLPSVPHQRNETRWEDFFGPRESIVPAQSPQQPKLPIPIDSRDQQVIPALERRKLAMWRKRICLISIVSHITNHSQLSADPFFLPTHRLTSSVS
jgi:hypothetical protein